MRTLLSFLAGFFATLIFHQLTLALLWWVRVAPFAPILHGSHATVWDTGGAFASILGWRVGYLLWNVG